MANHKSSIKRIRQTETRREQNRYHAKTMRSALKNFRALKNKSEAVEKLPGMVAMIDKLSKGSVIHKNKAANLKSGIMKQVNALQ
jgi:small subunit ribosomal protein S20